MLTIIRGDTKHFKFKRTRKNDGSVITEIPNQMYFTVKYSDNVDDILFQKTLNNEITYNGEDNYYCMTINPNDTNNLPYGKLVFDIEITNGNDITTIAGGEINIISEVTFASNKESYYYDYEIFEPSDKCIEEIITFEEYAPTTIINKEVDLSGIEHDIENLTELVKENQDNIKQLQKDDITIFNTGKPSADGLITINATTKNNQSIQAFNIYNGLDAKYLYAAAGTQVIKDLNDRIKILEEKVQQLETSQANVNDEW